MAKEKKQLPWQDVDPSAVKGNKAYDAYKAAIKEANEKRALFETAFIEAARKSKENPLADNETLRFSYKFGKLSVAKDAKDAVKSVGGTFKL